MDSIITALAALPEGEARAEAMRALDEVRNRVRRTPNVTYTKRGAAAFITRPSGTFAAVA